MELESLSRIREEIDSMLGITILKTINAIKKRKKIVGMRYGAALSLSLSLAGMIKVRAFLPYMFGYPSKRQSQIVWLVGGGGGGRSARCALRLCCFWFLAFEYWHCNLLLCYVCVHKLSLPARRAAENEMSMYSGI